jgi:hypothetical protein
VVRAVAVIVLLAGCGRLGFETDGEYTPNGPGFCAQATFPNPGTSDFADDFTIDPFTDRWFPVATCITQIDGEVVASPPAFGDYCHAWTLGDHHLTCDSVTVRVAEVTAMVPRAQTLLYISSITADAQLHVLLEGGSFLLVDDDVTAPYDPALDLWWRLREHDGVVFLEVSADGVAWSERARRPTPVSLDHVQIAIGAGTWGDTVDNPGSARFRCYNVPPPCG